MADPFEIPKFLRIPQEERKAAWEQHRAARKILPPEPKPYRPITGATPDDDAKS